MGCLYKSYAKSCCDSMMIITVLVFQRFNTNLFEGAYWKMSCVYQGQLDREEVRKASSSSALSKNWQERNGVVTLWVGASIRQV